MELTEETIREDIKAYQDRLRTARDKLSALPTTAPISEERRKIKDRRRTLLQEIEHVRGLIALANEALSEFG